MSKSDMVYRYTASKIESLHSIADTGRGKGYLAELRHGIGKKPGELPSLWWLIFARIDEELKGSKLSLIHISEYQYTHYRAYVGSLGSYQRNKSENIQHYRYYSRCYHHKYL